MVHVFENIENIILPFSENCSCYLNFSVFFFEFFNKKKKKKNYEPNVFSQFSFF